MATAPLLHRELWYPLVLRASQRNSGGWQLPKLDGAWRIGDGTRIGAPLGVPGTAWPLPEGLADLPALANRITAPSRTWVRGIDYFLRDGQVVFPADPLADPLTGARWAGAPGTAPPR